LTFLGVCPDKYAPYITRVKMTELLTSDMMLPVEEETVKNPLLSYAFFMHISLKEGPTIG